MSPHREVVCAPADLRGQQAPEPGGQRRRVFGADCLRVGRRGLHTPSPCPLVAFSSRAVRRMPWRQEEGGVSYGKARSRGSGGTVMERKPLLWRGMASIMVL